LDAFQQCKHSTLNTADDGTKTKRKNTTNLSSDVINKCDDV